MKKFILLFFLQTLFLGDIVSAQETQIVVYDLPPNIPIKGKPHTPAKKNIEAWINESILTIVFMQSEGMATINFATTKESNHQELVYSTAEPIIIDTSFYGEISSFTIFTEIGRTYIGFINLY